MKILMSFSKADKSSCIRGRGLTVISLTTNKRNFVLSDVIMITVISLSVAFRRFYVPRRVLLASSLFFKIWMSFMNYASTKTIQIEPLPQSKENDHQNIFGEITEINAFSVTVNLQKTCSFLSVRSVDQFTWKVSSTSFTENTSQIGVIWKPASKPTAYSIFVASFVCLALLRDRYAIFMEHSAQFRMFNCNARLIANAGPSLLFFAVHNLQN